MCMPHFHQERTAITPAHGFTWELQKGLTYFCFEPPWSPDTFCTANLVNPHAYQQKKKTTRAPRHTLPSTIYSEQLGSGWELTPPGHPQGTGSSGFPSRKRSHVQQHPGTPSFLQESSLISSAQALLKIQGSTFKVLYGLGWMNAATDRRGTENKARRKTKPRCRQTKQLFHSDNLKAFKNHNMICCYHITVNNYLGASVHVNRATYFKSIFSSTSETTKHVLTNQKLQQEKLVS